MRIAVQTGGRAISFNPIITETNRAVFEAHVAEYEGAFFKFYFNVFGGFFVQCFC